MIERVERIHKGLGGEEIPPWSYNFPRASLVELAYRIRTEPTEIIAASREVMTGLRLTFGTGNPPDFGYGGTQNVLVVLPEQEFPRKSWRSRQTNANNAVAAIVAKIKAVETGTLNRAIATVLVARENQEYIETHGGTVGEIREALLKRIEAESAEDSIRNELAQLKTEQKRSEQEDFISANEEPSDWTPYVNASFQRAFDALRLQPIGLDYQPGVFIAFELQELLTIYRPDDLGPTYTAPLAGATTGRG